MDFDLLGWVVFPASVAAILAQIAPVIFLALIIELRVLRRGAQTRDEKKGLRYHLRAAFLGFFLVEVGTLAVVFNDGLEGETAFVCWMAVLASLVVDTITLWHTMRDDD